MFLLVPDDDLGLEDHIIGNDNFKPMETRAPLMPTVFPQGDERQPRSSAGYLEVKRSLPPLATQPELQRLALGRRHGPRASGVPTVARAGPDYGLVLMFAGYNPDDAPLKPTSNKLSGNHRNHRRPYFICIDVNVPDNTLVEKASDMELRSWIVSVHDGAALLYKITLREIAR
ncbi:hypothetical protein F4860DRAFT_520119 [Xylaria cubensis]|nr:hypothetical protein F4860DRAFT_520119 [Xylaria cubensis]